MVRLNKALKQIFIDNPYYSAGLYEKYTMRWTGSLQSLPVSRSQFVKQKKAGISAGGRSDYPLNGMTRRKKHAGPTWTI